MKIMKKEYQHNNTVILLAAYNNIASSLAIIKYSQKSIIFIFDDSSIYNFLKSLDLARCDLIFIKSKLKNLWNPINWIKEYINFLNVKRKLLSNISNYDVYFYAFAYANIVQGCINFLKKRNRIIYGTYASLKIDMSYFIQVKRGIRELIVSLIYHNNYYKYNTFGNNISGFSKNYINELPCKKFKRYELDYVKNKYAVEVNSDKPFIIFLDSNDNYQKIIYNYKTVISDIFNILSDKNVYVKPHPKLGASTFIKKFGCNYINKMIPVEFIKKRNIEAIIGISSISLANAAISGIKAISIIYMLKYVDEDLIFKYINYLKKYGGNSIIYPKTLLELKRLLH